MTSPSARKGYTAEHAIEELLTAQGYDGIYRPRAGARDDHGDIRGLPITISVKNRKVMDLAGWVDALRPMIKANRHFAGVVWHKRRGRASPLNWYVTMTGADFLDMLGPYLDHYDQTHG